MNFLYMLEFVSCKLASISLISIIISIIAHSISYISHSLINPTLWTAICSKASKIPTYSQNKMNSPIRFETLLQTHEMI